MHKSNFNKMVLVLSLVALFLAGCTDDNTQNGQKEIPMKEEVHKAKTPVIKEAKAVGVSLEFYMEPEIPQSGLPIPFEVRVKNPQGELVSVSELSLSLNHVNEDFGQNHFPLDEVQTGVYKGEGSIPKGGDWKARAIIKVDKKQQLVSFPFKAEGPLVEGWKSPNQIQFEKELTKMSDLLQDVVVTIDGDRLEEAYDIYYEIHDWVHTVFYIQTTEKYGKELADQYHHEFEEIEALFKKTDKNKDKILEQITEAEKLFQKVLTDIQ
jgi:hypothetical protein